MSNFVEKDSMPVSGSTKVFALFGDPVTHSLSPVMQNRAFRALGLDCCYVPFHVCSGELAAAVAAVRALNLGGVNLTIPHKEQVLSYLDEVDQEALLIGAVNTIVNRNGFLCGYNTDASGFLASLLSLGFDPLGKRAVILGAGGAARAVSFALAGRGVSQIDICNRSLEKAEHLARDLTKGTKVDVRVRDLSTSFMKVLQDAELLVNTTPVGMYPHHQVKPLVMKEELHPGLLVCDLVYNPIQTRLLEEAALVGCSVLSGVGMLAHQGAFAFQLWTGREAPADLMQDVVEEALRNISE